MDTPSIEKWRGLLTVTVTLLALFALCCVLVWLGLRIHHTLLLFALGGLLAYALAPLTALVEGIKFGKRQRQLGRTSSVFVVYAGIFVIFAAFGWWLGDHMVAEVKFIQQDTPKYHDRAIDLAKQLDDNYLKPHGITFSAEDTIQNPPLELNAYLTNAGKSALPYIAHTVTALAESAVVLLIALYLLIFGSDLRRRANQSLSPLLLAYAEPWEEDVNRILGGFVRGQLMVALVTGSFAAVGLLLFGVHAWLVLGLLTVLASLIPFFGPYVAAVPAIIAALITPTHFTPVAGAIAVLILYVVVNEAAGKVLYPRLVGEALQLHEVFVLFVLFAGVEIDGIVGALLAAPTASLALITVVHLYRLWQQIPEEPISIQLLRKAKR